MTAVQHMSTSNGIVKAGFALYKFSTIKGDSITYLAIKGAIGARSAWRRRQDPPAPKKKTYKVWHKEPYMKEAEKIR